MGLNFSNIFQEVFGSDLLVSRLGLNLLLYKEHSRAGQVTIKCSATLPPVKGDQVLTILKDLVTIKYSATLPPVKGDQVLVILQD